MLAAAIAALRFITHIQRAAHLTTGSELKSTTRGLSALPTKVPTAITVGMNCKNHLSNIGVFIRLRQSSRNQFRVIVYGFIDNLRKVDQG